MFMADIKDQIYFYNRFININSKNKQYRTCCTEQSADKQGGRATIIDVYHTALTGLCFMFMSSIFLLVFIIISCLTFCFLN